MWTYKSNSYKKRNLSNRANWDGDQQIGFSDPFKKMIWLEEFIDIISFEKMNYSKKDLEVLQEDLDKAVRDGMLEKDMVEEIIRGVNDLDKTREEIKEVYELKEIVN